MEKKRKNITVIVTDQCGLGCSYCFESNVCNVNYMEFPTLQKIIEDEMNIEDGYDEVIWDFFGGEPFRAFELIKKAYDFLHSCNWPKAYLCFSTTNGIYVHGKIKDWLLEHKDSYWCALSIDGTPEMHNENRNNSFEKIDVNFFAKSWPSQPIKMTISPTSIKNLAEGVIFLVEKYGFQISMSFAQGVEWDIEKSVLDLKRELRKLTQYYIDHDTLALPTILDYKIYTLAFEREDEKWCGCGEGQKAYYTDGTAYPCQTFSPLSNPVENDSWRLGDFKADIGEINNECKNCFMRPLCPTCYGMNYLQKKSMVKRDTSLCRLNQECIRASAIVQAERILKKYHQEIPKDIPAEEYYTLKEAVAIDNIENLSNPGNN